MKLFSRKKETIPAPTPTNSLAKPAALQQSSGSPREIRGAVGLSRVKNVLRRPVLTEKAVRLQDDGNYVFEVSVRAEKPEIKKAVEQTFGVNVEAVRVINKKSKRRVWRGTPGRAGGLKKAIVKLAGDQKIEVLPK